MLCARTWTHQVLKKLAILSITAGWRREEKEMSSSKRPAQGRPEPPLTSTDVHFIEGVLGRGEHAHIRAELLCQCFNHVLSGCCARDPNTFCCKVSSSFILKIKSHDSMKLQILQENKMTLLEKLLWNVHLLVKMKTLSTSFLQMFTLNILEASNPATN